MATRDPAFDIVAQLEVDQANFTRDLKKAEAVVTKSAAAMQGSISRLSISTTTLSGTMSAAGAAGTLLGSSLGGVASAAGAATAAIGNLTAVLGPWTLAFAAATAVAFFFKDELGKLVGGLGLATEAIDKQADKMLARAAEIRAAGLVVAPGFKEAQEKEKAEQLAQQLFLKTRIAFLDNKKAEAARKELETQNKIIAAIERKLEVDRQAQQSQRLTEVGLARQLALQLGLVKQSQLAGSFKEKLILEQFEKLSGAGTAAGGGGFSVGTTASSQFRFGGGAGNIALGQQNEQKKTNDLLEEIKEEIRFKLGEAILRIGDIGVVGN